MSQSTLPEYKNTVNQAFTSLSEAVGVHVMAIVGEYSLWRVKHKFGDSARVTVSEVGFHMEGLDCLSLDKAQEISNELLLGIIETLGRLVGVKMANELAEQLKMKTQEGDVE